MAAFRFPRSVPLARVPTPIEHLPRLSRMLEGPDLYIKRDDLTGVELTGNKVRKLEFVLAEALEQGCDTVMTCGGSQSNHARATAAAAAKTGLRSHLVLRDGGGPGDMGGNLFLDRLFGAEVTFITPQQYESIDELMEQMANNLRSAGRKPYVIPEGASNALGSLGYVKAVQELATQLRELALRIDHLVFAVGSGGTQAGLLLGKLIFELPAEIHGFNVCDSEAYFVNRIAAIMRDAKRRFGLEVAVEKRDIHIIDGYVGKGYGLSRQEEIDAIKRVAQLEGIILDPVYTGKAMFGLMDQIRRGRFRQGEKVLFLHTGGVFGLFPKRSLFF
jgi:D-cysteine desulfhydrase